MTISRRAGMWILVLGLVLAFLTPGVAAKGPAPRAQAGVSIENPYIKIVVAAEGTMTMGTTGGSPDVSGDENKRLLFGFPEASRTGFPSLRLIKGDKTIDIRLDELTPAEGPHIQGQAIVTRWQAEGILVTQEIGFFTNPYSGRPDMAHIRYTVRNQSSEALQAGVRCVLDIQVGDNDYAPFFLPGFGTTNREMSFEGGSIPDYYKAYESPDFDEDALRGMGFARGFGLTVPDRLAIATWQASRGGGVGIFGTAWDYTVDPTAEIGDSTVVYWWNPRALAANAEYTVSTVYGLAGPAGGTAALSVPASVGCSVEPFELLLTVRNTSLEVLRNGSAMLGLPAGTNLAPGYHATVGLGDLAPGQMTTVSWQAQITALDPGNVVFVATVSFDNLPAPLTATATVQRPDCRPPTATPTPTLPYIPIQSPTPTVALTPTPMPPSEVPEPASLLLLLGGLGGLAAWARRHRRR